MQRLLFTKVDDRQLMKEFLPEFRPELLEAADFNLYMFPHRLIHTHMPGRRVSKSDLICFPSFITQIRPIMTLKSNNLYSIQAFLDFHGFNFRNF